MLFDFYRKNGYSQVWLTTNPDNMASQKSALLAGAEYVDTLKIPLDHELVIIYGDTYSSIFKIDLNKYLNSEEYDKLIS